MTAAVDSDGLTAFERRRAANAKANNEILNSISKTSAKVFGSPKTATATKKRSVPRRVKSESSGAVAQPPVTRATRRSLRVAGIEADPSATSRKRGVDLEHGLGESAEKTAREKRLRVSGDLDMSAMQVEGRWQTSLQGLSGLAMSRPGAQPGRRTFTDANVKETTDKQLKSLRVELNGLQLYDKFHVKDLKLTKDRIYAMAFHPTLDKAVVIAGDKEGRLGIFDASQEPDVPVKEEDADDDDDDEPEPVIVGFKPHARTISSIYVPDSDPNAVFTASYDTTIRKLDLHAQKSVEVYAPSAEGEGADDVAISCMDMASDSPHVVYFSTLRGSLGRHDLRSGGGAATRAGDELWPGLHGGHKIGGFSLSPRQPHLLATASLDRTVKIWDLRKMDIVDDENDVAHGQHRPWLVGSDPAPLSVSHAAWGPGGQLATTSYDDNIRVYDLYKTLRAPRDPGFTLSAAELAPTHHIRHNNQTGRWVTILKPQWQRHPLDGAHKFVVGNMNRFVDVFAANGEQLAQLDGDGITAVPAVAQLHPSRNWVAGGNSSGKLTLWM